MKLTIQLQLLPSVEQASILLATMERFNEAATFAARLAFDAGVFSQPSVHKLAYALIRRRFGLSSQLAVRAIGKAVEVFARDKSVCPVFRKHGAVTYDQRNLSFKGLDKVSLATLGGRQLLGLIYGEYQAERFDRIKGQCDLIYCDDKFFLLATVEFQEPPPIEPKDWLGVDLGIVNLAADSDGNTHTGERVEKIRKRFARTRQRLQRKGTKSAKRILKKIRRRESRFRRHENHVISKQIVASAKGTGRGIVLENLKGIRDRITVGRKQRSRQQGWAFFQLRSFVEYKAKLAGVPVMAVDPRNTSRTCSKCGHCEKANRKSQGSFVCQHCGFSENADLNAARNLRALGLGSRKPTSVAASLRA